MAFRVVTSIKKLTISLVSIFVLSFLIISGSAHAGEGGNTGSGGWPGCTTLTYFATCYGATWQWYSTNSDHVFIDGWTGANRSFAQQGYIDGCASAGGYWRYAMVIKTDDPPGNHGNVGWLYAGHQVGLIGIGGSDDWYFNSEYFGGGMNYIGDNWSQVEAIYLKLQEYDPATYWRGWNYYSNLSWFCGPGSITEVKPPVVEYTLTGYAKEVSGKSLRGYINDVWDTVEEGNWASVTRNTKTGYRFLRWEDEYGNLLTTGETYGETMTRDRTIYAIYEQQEFAGRARVSSGSTVSGSGTGFVKQNSTYPIEVECPNTGCTVAFDLAIKTVKGTGNANYTAYRSTSQNGTGTRYDTYPRSPSAPSTSGTTLDLYFGLNRKNPYVETLYPGQTVCYYLSFAPNGDTAYVSTKACAYAKPSTFQGKVTVTSKSGTGTIDWRDSSRVDTHNIDNCPVTGCKVTFRHYLRRTSGIGASEFTISRTSNYEEKVTSSSNLKSGTETFSVSPVEEYVDSELTLVPGQVVCETLAFKASNNTTITVNKTELKLCASALGKAQPDDPPTPDELEDDDLSDAFLDMRVKNNDGPSKYKKYRKAVYAKPDQRVYFRATYNPILQYSYYIYPQKMRIDSGAIKPDRVNISQTLGGLFNTYKSSSQKNWSNAVTIYATNGFTYSVNKTYNPGSTTKQKEINDRKITIDDVGKDLSEAVATNLNNNTKTTPSQVTFTSDSSKNNLATVSTANKSSDAHVYVPYNFGTKVEIKTKSTDPIYSGEEKEIKYDVEITPRANSETTNGPEEYATKVPKSISRIIIYIPKNNTTRTGSEAWGSQGENSNICSYYGLAKDGTNCKYDDERTGPLNQSGNVKGELKEYTLTLNTPDLPAGTNICVSVAHYPSSSGLPTNWNNIEGSGKWHISDSVCFVIAKRPSFQVWGGSLYSGGSVNTSAAQKTTLRYLPAFTGTFVFSSWVEQSVVAKGRVIALASGAATGLADNIAGGGSLETTPDYCKYRVPLSIANYSRSATALICNNSQSTGNSGIAANITDKASLVATLPNEDSLINTYDNGTAIPFNNTTLKNVVRYNVDGNAAINNTTIQAGRTHIVKATGDVAINGNVIYEEKAYTNMSEIPKVIIYGRSITIGCTVERIDAIIIAEETLNTCNSDDINSRQNSTSLRVNGAIITNKLYLNRTYGAAWGEHSKKPAEVVNYDASTLLWGRAKADPDNEHKNLTSVYIHELSPRF
ncbi:hypothetical protein IJS18_01090 [Candidatus Saccharibacteria bacterium]|nr:hypothetical protein [Candidatus Saccharibacteria bacterium]